MDSKILSKSAIQFILALHEEFRESQNSLLQSRIEREKLLEENGFQLDFLEETQILRDSDWKISKVPNELLERTVEITGPPERKMMINALNSATNCYMCDFEDSLSPIGSNVLDGYNNLYDFARRNLEFYDTAKLKKYSVHDYQNTPSLFIRPRGLHMVENNISADNTIFALNSDQLQKAGLKLNLENKITGWSSSLLDFGLFFFHNAVLLIKNDTSPYFYLPKLESHLEARWWNQVFNFAQDYMQIPRGTIKATVLIEHIFAAFEMDEILYELRTHSAGLNCGRWDYIFSFIKKTKFNPNYIMPDRSQITMNTHFMKSYVKLIVYTCHKRGAHAMGGMSAQLPIKNDPKLNQQNLDKVYQDKAGEAAAGMDGTWIAHPNLLETAKRAFREHRKIEGPNQLEFIVKCHINKYDLLKKPLGEITWNGVKTNIHAMTQYMKGWTQGVGAVAINNMMEDAATAEISRMQLWQWLYHQVEIEGENIDFDKLKNMFLQEFQNSEISIELQNKILDMISSKKPPEFLTNYLL